MRRIVTFSVSEANIQRARGGSTDCPIARALTERYGRKLGVGTGGGIYVAPYRSQRDCVGTLSLKGKKFVFWYDLLAYATPGTFKLYAREGFPDEPETRAAEHLVKRLSKSKKTPRKGKNGNVLVAAT